MKTKLYYLLLLTIAFVACKKEGETIDKIKNCEYSLNGPYVVQVNQLTRFRYFITEWGTMQSWEFIGIHLESGEVELLQTLGDRTVPTPDHSVSGKLSKTGCYRLKYGDFRNGFVFDTILVVNNNIFQAQLSVSDERLSRNDLLSDIYFWTSEDTYPVCLANCTACLTGVPNVSAVKAVECVDIQTDNHWPVQVTKHNNSLYLTMPEDIPVKKRLLLRVKYADASEAYWARDFMVYPPVQPPVITGVNKTSFKKGDTLIFKGENLIYTGGLQLRYILNDSKKDVYYKVNKAGTELAVPLTTTGKFKYTIYPLYIPVSVAFPQEIEVTD